ncbi:MAG TPA: RagB/SusD family nutrient uptake outer membrane protein, partial [Bacteroidales bacterium]|nr:RagB/SusD family nutrient uptake outer membrane protein [Bacteroidales bacterium]
MRKIYIFITIFAVVGFLSSCDKDFLETKPLTEFSEVDVWNDPALVETFINQIYWRLDEPFSNGRLKSNIVDEGHYRGNGASKNFNNCLLTVDQIPGWSTPSRYRSWNDIYKTIRYCNIFFANIEKVPFEATLTDGKTLGDRMKGEVHFLRAYLYHELTAVYGGVPIITKPYGLSDDFLIERSSYADCVDFMVSELDLAAGLLPETHSGDAKGRATKGAALALKARVLLYAASDLYNTTVFPGYSNPELIGYTGGSRTERWTAAKNAAKAVIDLGLYSLYKAEPAPTDSVAQNLAELFIAQNTEEDIFIKYFTTNQRQMYGIVTGPNGYHNWGTNAPIQEMVDAYEMKDGSKFDWNNPAHASLPYANREPRFYATVLYEGAVWKPRPADVQNVDPIGIIQVGKWERWDEETQSVKIHYGVDTRQSTVENWNGSYTGYYLRKGLDPAVDAQYFYATVPWRWMRYAEV